MYARIESAPSTGRVQLDPRLVGGGLAAALAIGVIAGFAAATLNTHAPSTVASHAPAATVSAPSTGVYGDRDSRLPIATVSAGSLNDRNVGRNLVPNSVMSELDRANAARAITSPGNSLCDRNSCGTLVTSSNVSALDRAMAARIAALQGMAAVDWNAAAGAGYGVRDSRPPLAPFKLR